MESSRKSFVAFIGSRQFDRPIEAVQEVGGARIDQVKCVSWSNVGAQVDPINKVGGRLQVIRFTGQSGDRHLEGVICEKAAGSELHWRAQAELSGRGNAVAESRFEGI